MKNSESDKGRRGPRASVVTVIALGTAGAAFALGGCGSTTAQDVGSVASEHPHALSPTSPLQVAGADAKALAASIGRVPGAVLLSSPPAGLSASVMQDQIVAGEPVRVDAWYSVSAPYASVLSEAEARLPSWADGGLHGMAGTGTQMGIPLRNLMVTQNSGGTITQREINLSVLEMTAETSVLEVDVTENYRPAKTAVETFPTGGVLDVAVRPEYDSSAPADSFAVTDQGTIARVAAILDALPTVAISEPVSCPIMRVPSPGAKPTMHELELTFRRSAGGPAVVEVTLDQPATNPTPSDVCGGATEVAVTVAASPQPALDASGSSAYVQVASAVGYAGTS